MVGQCRLCEPAPIPLPWKSEKNITMRTQRIDVDEEEVLQLIEELQLRDCWVQIL